MARQLLLTGTSSQAGLAAVTLLLCASALFMCASHARKWHRRWSACYSSTFHYEEDPVIQLNTGAMFVTTERVHGGEDGDGGVWQKNILMGGKCQLPDFSGVIIYDSAGNIVAPAKTSRAVLS